MADRRVRRTRDLLHRALIELILEKGYDRLTVQDILDRADVGRSTFYTHYASKDELLLSGLDDLRAAFAHISASPDSTGQPESLLAPLRPLFEHAAGNQQLFHAMLGSRGAAVAFRAGRRMLSQTLTSHLRTQLAIEDQNRLDIAVVFTINGLIGLLTWWLDTESQLTADQLFARFEELAAPGLEAFLTSSGQE